MSINHYRTLGLANFASAREVQKAFRMLAIQYHPDKHRGSTIFEHKFKEVNAAYQVLSDPIQKAQYDNLLKYGAFTTTTTHQAPQTNKRTWTPPPVQELKYTPFQEVYIKVSLGVVALYLGILILSHAISSPESPAKMLEEVNNNYFKKAIQYTESKQLEKASCYLDSIILIGNASAYYSDLERDLLIKTEELSVDYFNKKDYAQSLKNYLFLEHISYKYDYDFSYKNKARIIMCLAYTNQSKELDRKIKRFKELPIEDFASAFDVTNALLFKSKLMEAEELSRNNLPAFMEQVQAKYGAVYTDVLRSGMYNDRLLKPTLQYLCLSKNFNPTRDIGITEDLYRDMLVIEAEKSLFNKLRSFDYKIKNIPKDFTWSESDKSILRLYDLHTLYKLN